MMANGLQKMSKLAYYTKGIAKVIRAFLAGGWYGAAIEAVKQFWPQILAISVALTLIPIIIFLQYSISNDGLGNLVRYRNIPNDREHIKFIRLL